MAARKLTQTLFGAMTMNCQQAGTKLITRTTLVPLITSSQRYINLQPKLKEFVHCDYQDNLNYGVYALTTGYIKESAIEAARVSIVRKGQTKEVVKPLCESPFTSKPVGTRMGKGKGKVNYWAAKAIAGQVLFEYNCANDSLAREAFRQVKAKLPVRVHLRIRPREPRDILSADDLTRMFAEHSQRNERLGLTGREAFPV